MVTIVNTKRGMLQFEVNIQMKDTSFGLILNCFLECMKQHGGICKESISKLHFFHDDVLLSFLVRTILFCFDSFSLYQRPWTII